MPNFICKFPNEDLYFVFSTIVDAPVTMAMDLGAFKKYYQEEYGKQGMDGLARRLERVFKNNTSERGSDSIEDTIWLNRYGPNESRLPVDVFLKKLKRESGI